MKKLTEKEEAGMLRTESRAKDLGLETMARKIAQEEFILDEDTYMKFNIPDSEEKFKSGNGEGVWAMPLTPDDRAIYKDDSAVGKKFQVIILNDALTYPIEWGSIITVESRGDDRPVLSYDWFDSVVRKSSDGGTTLAEILKDFAAD